MPTKATPIPQGRHNLTPHMIIREASRAIDFYKQVFGAREIMRMPGPDGNRIMHAELQIGDSILMLCDEFPEMGGCSPLKLNGTPVVLHLYVENADEVFARAVKAGAQALMPVSDMFWGDRYGKLKDPFGHEWSIATHQYDLTPAEMQKAMASAFAQAPGAATA